jgi:uncharacterized coiled-coil DUF342 family protein
MNIRNLSLLEEYQEALAFKDAEIERLKDRIDKHHRIFEPMRAEIEQLLAQIKLIRDDMKEYCCTATDHPCGCYDQFLSEKAEIARLHECGELMDAGIRLAWKERDDLRAFLHRISGANDNPSCFNPNVEAVLNEWRAQEEK